MALQFCDNFQQYGTNTANMTNGVYANVNQIVALVADPDATAGGTTVLALTPVVHGLGSENKGSYLRKVLPTAQDTIGIAGRIWLNSLPDNSNVSYGIQFEDANGVAQVTIFVTPTGSLRVMRGGPHTPGSPQFGDGVQIAESTNSVVANAWQHLEMKVKVHATLGTVEIRTDTVPILVATGLNTLVGLSTIAAVSWFATDLVDIYGAIQWRSHWKDVSIWDTTGALNNSFLGSCFVYSMRPDSDVSGTWSITGGGGSGWASINETNPDDDTKYVSSPWPAATADVFTVTDLPTDATTVKGMMSMVRSRKSDGGDGQLQVSLVSGASTGNGSNRPITTAYTYWTDIFETDPATAAAWTVAAANAVKLKLDRTL